MFNKQVNGVLTLIALSIFADKRVLSSEITAFIKSAEQINKNVRSEIPITEAKLLMWFETNRLHLRERVNLRPAGFKHWFDTVLEDVAEYKDKLFLMEMIDLISNADGELHISEKALMVLVDKTIKDPRKYG